jgi:hypothetical protein
VFRQIAGLISEKSSPPDRPSRFPGCRSCRARKPLPKRKGFGDIRDAKGAGRRPRGVRGIHRADQTSAALIAFRRNCHAEAKPPCAHYGISCGAPSVRLRARGQESVGTGMQEHSGKRVSVHQASNCRKAGRFQARRCRSLSTRGLTRITCRGRIGIATLPITLPLSGDTGPPLRRVFVFLGCEFLRLFRITRVHLASRLPRSIRVNDSRPGVPWRDNDLRGAGARSRDKRRRRRG